MKCVLVSAATRERIRRPYGCVLAVGTTFPGAWFAISLPVIVEEVIVSGLVEASAVYGPDTILIAADTEIPRP